MKWPSFDLRNNRNKWHDPWNPKVNWFAGSALLVSAIWDFFSGPQGCLTGSWSGLYRNITALVGHNGFVAFEAFVGLAFIVQGYVNWIHEKSLKKRVDWLREKLLKNSSK